MLGEKLLEYELIEVAKPKANIEKLIVLLHYGKEEKRKNKKEDIIYNDNKNKQSRMKMRAANETLWQM